jgi:hypothetical protein
VFLTEERICLCVPGETCNVVLEGRTHRCKEHVKKWAAIRDRDYQERRKKKSGTNGKK